MAQYLRHRQDELDAAVAQVTGRRLIGWLDPPMDRRTGRPAKEWRGIDFPPDDPTLEVAWSAFWLTGRGVRGWDAVGRLEGDGQSEWLLVGAEAHLEELITHCGARPHGGLPKIQEAFHLTKAAVGVDESPG